MQNCFKWVLYVNANNLLADSRLDPFRLKGFSYLKNQHSLKFFLLKNFCLKVFASLFVTSNEKNCTHPLTDLIKIDILAFHCIILVLFWLMISLFCSSALLIRTASALQRMFVIFNEQIFVRFWYENINIHHLFGAPLGSLL